MSDTNPTVIELKEQVALLEQALKREKNAKQALEQKLSANIQENFEKNRAFFSAFEQANSRQIQLKFLASITDELFSVRGLNEMLIHFVSQITRMLSACNTFNFIKSKGDEYSVSQFDTTEKTFKLLPAQESLKDTLTSIIAKSPKEDCWHRIEVDTICNGAQLFENETLLVVSIPLSKVQTNYIVLDLDHYCYSDNFKQTLNTASQQFSLAVKRKLTELELSYNYRKLEKTVEELKSTQSQLVHSEKMASLGQLSAGVAHEINNPLGFIGSNIQVLKEYAQSFEHVFVSIEQTPQNDLLSTKDIAYARKDIISLIDSCINGIERISDIVSSLKTFSRKGNQEYHPTDINEVISSSLNIVWNQLKYNYIVESQLDEKLPEVKGNTGELQQVFINLFVNAAQSMKDTAQGKLSISSELNGEYIKVTVNDTGCGMDERALKHLFEPFYTTKDEHEGTGLGLSVSYAILEKHSAIIEVDSTPNEGSTFTIRFPAIV
ncbi:sensor histidine kinase [Thalassotalea atypica]|uniref:sensor histidine kinase n=1 Tax=Thalassotalea atypica TaxID=2054316 RepID=UPI00257332BB|nr:ATP-binding protein [Thalassotalea atypica]